MHDLTTQIQRRLVVAWIVAAWSGPALAMDASNKEAIRLLANEAAREYEDGRYDVALERFQRAYETAKIPRLAVWIGKAQAKLGHLVAANEMFRQAINLEKNDLWVGTAQQEAQREAKQELSALQPRIPRLTVRVAGATAHDVALRIDDVEVPSTLIGLARLADPGQRTIVGRVGEAELRETVTLAEGEMKEILLTFPNRAPTTDSADAQPSQTSPSRVSDMTSKSDTPHSRGRAQRTWGWVSLGVGAAGAVFGATTGIMVVAKHGQLSSDCPNHRCEPANWTASNSFNTLRNLTTIGFVVAGVGAATGLTLLLTSPKSESKPAASLWLSPASAGFKGTF